MQAIVTNRLNRYHLLVCVAGAIALAMAVVTDRPPFTADRRGLVLLVLFVIAGEVWPIRVPRSHGSGEDVPSSTTFAFALLLLGGLPATVVALGGASLVADFARRKPTLTAAFRFATYVLGLTAAGAVLSLVGSSTATLGSAFGFRVVAAVLAAGLTFFAVTHLLAAVANGLARGGLREVMLSQDLVFQASTSGVLLALTPVLVAAGANPFLVPLLALPLVMARRYAATLVEKEHQSLHDHLTGLPNRELFRSRVNDAVAAAVAEGRHVGVVLIDLDDFKEVNDTLGHRNGDFLLQQVGSRLAEAVPNGGLACRLGGDEFAVLLPDAGTEEVATAVAREVLHSLGETFAVGGLVLEVGASAGLALAPAHCEDGDTLLQRADVAMYQSKERRVSLTTYRPSLDPYSPERLAMVGELRRAIEQGQITVVFQPKASIDSGLVTGVEALVRWRHPTMGTIAPVVFLPLLQRAGLSRALTKLVLDRALDQCRRWHEDGLLLGMAVNVTESDLTDPRFLADVADALERHGVSAAWLQLEITEETVMRDPVRLMGVLAILREMGIQLALDDFGTGYSSLSYLSRLRVSELKIDKSFVMGMATGEHDAVIVRSTIDLAHNLGLRAVAEGVEDEDCWERLGALGCDVAQGYLLHRPVSGEELTQWLVGRCAQGTPAAEHERGRTV